MCTFVYVISHSYSGCLLLTITMTTLRDPGKTKQKLKLQINRDKVNLDRKYKICPSSILQAKIYLKSETALLVLD